MGKRLAGVFTLFNRMAKLRSATAGVLASIKPRAVVVEGLERRQMLSTSPNDPSYPLQWHLNNTGQFAADTGDVIDGQIGTPGADINAINAWDLTTGSGDVVVAVLDTGLDVDHPDLAANVFTNTGEIPDNGIDDDANGFIDDVHGWDFADGDNDVTDIEGHGTHVSGIIGAVGNNGVGVSGVNWNVKILPIKIFRNTGSFNLEGYVAGFEYAIALKRSGVNIVAMNASLGGFDPLYPEVEAKAVERANEAGILFVAAAGNDRADVNLNPFYPARFSLNLPNTITVASTDNQDLLSRFSNFGVSTVQVAAPGTAVTSTWSRDADENGDDIPDGTAYKAISGTSMATPVVTGIVALAKAYVPSATPAQLKEAILAGVDRLSSLDPLYSLPPYVSTTGRIDAYSVLRTVANSVYGNLKTLGGSWIRAYGGEGHVVVGSTSSIPTYVNFSTTGATENILDPETNRNLALQTPDGQSRVLAQLESASSFSINLDFTDNNEHRVTIYAVDAQKRNRSQTVQVVDTASGTVLRQVNMSGFEKGTYETFDLRGGVKLVVTATGRGSAIVNGVFFDAVPVEREALVATDTTTRGSWKNKYGTAGAFVVGDSRRFPSFAGVDVVGASQRTIKSTTTSSPALQKVTGSKRTVSYLRSKTSFDIRIDFTDDETRRVGLYMVDFDAKARAQRVDLLDENGQVLTNVIVSKFTKGQWVFFDFDTVAGAKTLRVTSIAGKDAVVSGIFFDAAPQQNAFYRGTDSTTSGTWKGKYGFDGQYVPRDPDSNIPSFVTLTENGEIETVATSTNDPVALQKIANGADRQAGYLQAPGTLTVDLNFTDSSSHRVSFYAADFSGGNRRQRIDIIDASTGLLLNTVDFGNFENGKYVSYDVSGHVTVNIRNISGPNAVLSAIFFD